jgi:phenylacetic acid degradation operon negative regulatory protein
MARTPRTTDALASRGLAGRLTAAAIGASGIEIGSTVQQQGLDLVADALGVSPERLWVGGDERTALRGAFPDGPGIVVISGTGTIAVGRDGLGGEHRCAGWGWILDGAGSAFDIGRDGLALALRMADGRVPRTALQARLWQALELDLQDPEAPQVIKARVVQAGFAPAGLAALAPVVEAMAVEGDAQATQVLRRHAQALVTSVVGVAQALQLQAPPIATLGGAITHLQTFRSLFREELQRRIPEAQLQVPKGDAASGALAIARELQGSGLPG